MAGAELGRIDFPRRLRRIGQPEILPELGLAKLLQLAVAANHQIERHHALPRARADLRYADGDEGIGDYRRVSQQVKVTLALHANTLAGTSTEE